MLEEKLSSEINLMEKKVKEVKALLEANMWEREEMG
jgi:hypothetical protein